MCHTYIRVLAIHHLSFLFCLFLPFPHFCLSPFVISIFFATTVSMHCCVSVNKWHIVIASVRPCILQLSLGTPRQPLRSARRLLSIPYPWLVFTFLATFCPKYIFSFSFFLFFTVFMFPLRFVLGIWNAPFSLCSLLHFLFRSQMSFIGLKIWNNLEMTSNNISIVVLIVP